MNVSEKRVIDFTKYLSIDIKKELYGVFFTFLQKKVIMHLHFPCKTKNFVSAV